MFEKLKEIIYDEDVYYMAYGSNLNSDNINSWCKNARIIGSSVLKGYKLSFKGSAEKYSYLTIEEDEKSVVPVGIYKLKNSDVRMLDKYEGYPDLYSKEYLDVMVNGKVVKALVYVMNKKYGYNIPSDMYYQTCVCGYEEFGFDEEFLKNALNEAISNAFIKRK